MGVAYDPDNGKYLAAALSTGAVQVHKARSRPLHEDSRPAIFCGESWTLTHSFINHLLTVPTGRPGLGLDRGEPQQAHERKEPHCQGEAVRSRWHHVSPCLSLPSRHDAATNRCVDSL